MSPRPPYFREVNRVVELDEVRARHARIKQDLSHALAWADHLAAIILTLAVDDDSNRDWLAASAAVRDYRDWFEARWGGDRHE
jgi:hypothetical protein